MRLWMVLFVPFGLLEGLPRLMWRRFIKDIMIPPPLPWPCFLFCRPPRDLRPCVSGWTPLLIIYHPHPSVADQHCSLFLGSLTFILRARYQYCSHCSKCSESKAALAILSMYAIQFLKVVFYLHWLFFTFKKYIHISFKCVLWSSKRLKKCL